MRITPMYKVSAVNVTTVSVKNEIVEANLPLFSHEKNCLMNKFCFINYRDDKKEFYGGDLTDTNNEPRFYTTKKRAYKKALEEIIEKFNENTKQRDLINILDSHKLCVHTYCAMD